MCIKLMMEKIDLPVTEFISKQVRPNDYFKKYAIHQKIKKSSTI